MRGTIICLINRDMCYVSDYIKHNGMDEDIKERIEMNKEIERCIIVGDDLSEEQKQYLSLMFERYI